MLSVSRYSQAYIDGCRAKMDRLLSSYDALREGMDRGRLDAFETEFFRNYRFGDEIRFGADDFAERNQVPLKTKADR
jgi:hypothetical protein